MVPDGVLLFPPLPVCRGGGSLSKGSRPQPREGDCWYFLCRIYRDSIHKPEALAAALEQLKRVDPREFYRSFDNMKPISAPGGNKTHRQYPNGPENSRYEPLPAPAWGQKTT